MRKETTSKHLDGITDLVVWAPIREGFIDAYENISYETRLRIVGEALHKVRSSAREHELITPFADTAERILTLLDFRIGIADQDLFQFDPDRPASAIRPRRYLYLAATFDGAWEPYMRLIWRPLGTFLDLLLCNCEGYVTALDHSFEDYAKWVREHQLDSAIFYSTTGLTVRDQLYLSELEQMQREGADDLTLAGVTYPDPAMAAKTVRDNPDPLIHAGVNQLALEALTVLYRLVDYYPADRLVWQSEDKPGEGRFLLTAAQELLRGWDTSGLPAVVEFGFRQPLTWFRTPVSAAPNNSMADPVLNAGEIQRGILIPHDDPGAPTTHGALLMMQIDDPAAAREFITSLDISWNEDPPVDGVFHNVAFTYEGLKRLNLSDEELEALPKEFREGMENRAGLIGDVRQHHPRRWTLPKRNWPPSIAGLPEPKRHPVELSEVDFVIHLRTTVPQGQGGATETALVDFVDFEERINAAATVASLAGHQIFSQNTDAETAEAVQAALGLNPLAGTIASLAVAAELSGVHLLAYESMFRPLDPATDYNAPALTRDHFGFVDGISQPSLFATGAGGRDRVAKGELLLGFANDRQDAASPLPPCLKDGSFLVVRKIAQHVDNWRDLLTQSTHLGLTPDALAARIVGRTRDGAALVGSQVPLDNDFDYKGDTKGGACPFAAHIRRSNPRDTFQQRPSPRILRRGMSYGPRFEDDPAEDRGVMFMAYNASIAEQFETIQRWLNGGNSTGVAAAQNDPLTGVGPKDGERVFRFTNVNAVARVAITKALTTLRWGTYLFVPSKSGLASIIDPLRGTRVSNTLGVPQGNDVITLIQNLPADVQPLEWKRILEDFLSKDPSEKAIGPDVWAAIRTSWDGVYRVVDGVELTAPEAAFLAETLELEEFRTGGTPKPQSVVLVGDQQKIMQVLGDTDTYSVIGQTERLKNSIGPIYVGQDPSPTYWAESTVTNGILYSIGEDVAFADGYVAGKSILDALKYGAAHLPIPLDFIELELRRQFILPALGTLCAKWFGIPDGTHFSLDGWVWAVAPGSPPPCPGYFLAPSRDAFYPRPTEAVTRYGKAHGQAIRGAARDFVAAVRAGTASPGTVSGRMFADPATDDAVLAQNLIGIMVGMLPPMDGNLRGILFDWLETKSLWRHQGALRTASGNQTATHASADVLRQPIAEAMCRRPAPDLLYRTAKKATQLGNVAINPGDLVIAGLVSATNENPGEVTAIFGGNRSEPGHPVHACPAQKMAMGATKGILAALLDSGRIQALPASLIVKISEWT